jgi:hypothetical protein
MDASIFLAPLQNLLSTFQTERHYLDNKTDNALVAMQTALIKTKEYLEESKGEKCFDRGQEYELSRLWAEAAVKARHASSELSARLNDKSLYWSDQFEWSAEEVRSRGIELNSLEEQIRKLLSSGRRNR